MVSLMKVALLLTCLTFSCFAKEENPVGKKTDFLRVIETDQQSKLQTAISVYTKADLKVSLIGAVHIADQFYYDALNKKFPAYDRLLFEMIGGERMGEIQRAGEKPNFLGKTYAAIARFLKLVDQKTAIDYSAENFVHADLTFSEYRILQKKRGESLLSFAIEASGNSTPKKQPGIINLLSAIVTGNADKIKLELIGTLGDGDDQIGELAGESVIITDRNAKCLQVLDTQLENGYQKIAIFYGAAHFPSMEKEMIARGFKLARQEWLDAWTVPKAPRKKSSPLRKNRPNSPISENGPTHPRERHSPRR